MSASRSLIQSKQCKQHSGWEAKKFPAKSGGGNLSEAALVHVNHLCCGPGISTFDSLCKMKFVALVSGGKDSCYAMHRCVEEGHHLVGLANLRPEGTDETDSYMYQTVAQNAVALYAQATGVALFERTLAGLATNTRLEYGDQVVEGDEVEDLYLLLLEARRQVHFEAVSCGAILSHYQSSRVQAVCKRLSLTLLAPLWQQDQHSLLKQMIDTRIEAIVVKVAALGLNPSHLGQTISEMYDQLVQLNHQYGLNVCGEGGEYETLTLDCPLFHKRIVV